MTEHRNGVTNLLHAKSGDHTKRGKDRSPFVLWAVAIFLLVLLIGGMLTYGFLSTTKVNQIVRGVSVDGVDLSYLSADDAARQLREVANDLRLQYQLEGQTMTLDPREGESPIVTFNVDAAIDSALDVGRDNNPAKAMAERVRAAFIGSSVDLPHTLDHAALRLALEKRFTGDVVAGRDARFAVTFDANGLPIVAVEPEEDGLFVNYDAVLRATVNRIDSLSGDPITVVTEKDAPKITVEDLEALKADAAKAILRAPFTVTAKSQTWAVSRRNFADWVSAKRVDGSTPVLAIDRAKFSTYIETLDVAVKTAPVDAQFEEKDGKVTTFVPSQDGETIDTDGSATAIETAAFGPDVPSTVELPMTVVHPDIDTEKSNPYGIKEVVGVGATNFKGSPRNRIHNVNVGANAVRGTLIAPGEEFSMLKTLGTIDASTGYLQELVIKENRTTPEYGGGLCQIGSTAFRAALDTGLLITQRQNHSYRVPYYERDGDGNDIGPGKDATIYDPAPDFRFKNDTANTILIWTNITGNKLTFTFWGVRDGRISEQTKARVYKIVAPPPKKVIQTTTLKVGEEKCTEHAHVGSEAIFTYTVTFADGTKTERDFQSHYRPWQEVCLIGVDPSVLPPGVTSQELVVPSPESTAADAPATPAAPATTP